MYFSTIFVIGTLLLISTDASNLRKATAEAEADAILTNLRVAARSAKAKFQEAVKSDSFGGGLPLPLVNQMVEDSMDFWDTVESVDRSDLESMEPEEGALFIQFAIILRSPLTNSENFIYSL